jgi:hypothetical protein
MFLYEMSNRDQTAQGWETADISFMHYNFLLRHPSTSRSFLQCVGVPRRSKHTTIIVVTAYR